MRLVVSAILVVCISITVAAAPARKRSAGVVQAQSSSINGYSGIDCSLLAPAYCTPELGCAFENNACKADPNLKPVINCTLLLASAGGAVQAEEASMVTALKSLKDLYKTVTSSMETAVESFTSVQQDWDSSMSSYNKSLVEYTKQAVLLDGMEAQLDQLSKNCSATPAPPWCDAEIAKLQSKIVEQNASVAVSWIKATEMQQKLEMTEVAVRAGNDEMAKANQLSQKGFIDAAGKISDATKVKQDALNYWNVIKNACLHAAPAISWPSATVSGPVPVASSAAAKKARLAARARLRRKSNKLAAKIA